VIRDFIKEGTLYAAAIATAKSVSLLFIPVFTQYFAAKDFGALEIFNIISLLSIGLFTFQIGQGIVRYSQTFGNDKMLKKQLSSTAFITLIVALSIGCFVLFINKKMILRITGLTDSAYEKTFLLALISIFLNGVISYLASHQQALRLKKEYATTLFAHAFLGIFTTYFFVIILDKSLNGFFYATIIVAPMIIFYQLFILKNEYLFTFNTRLFHKIMKFSAPLVPGALSILLLTVVDRLILNHLTNTATLGIYSVALKFAFGFQLIIHGYNTAIQPLIFEKYRNSFLPKKLAILFKGYVLVGAIGVVFLSLFARETIVLFTQKTYYNAYLVLPMLYCSAWVFGMTMFTTGMQIKEKTLLLSTITLTAVACNILLNFILIPIYDIKGAALASLISAFIYFISLRYFSRKMLFLEISKTTWLIIIALTSVLLIFSTSNFERIFVDVPTSTKIAFSLFALSVIVYKFRNTINSQDSSTQNS
jgi:O-antigen/teichoic acid export membrane protein